MGLLHDYWCGQARHNDNGYINDAYIDTGCINSLKSYPHFLWITTEKYMGQLHGYIWERCTVCFMTTFAYMGMLHAG